jgi:hypothetical protein
MAGGCARGADLRRAAETRGDYHQTRRSDLNDPSVSLDGQSLVTPALIRQNAHRNYGSTNGAEPTNAVASVAPLLQQVRDALLSGDGEWQAMAELFSGLQAHRSRLDASLWRAVIPSIQQHRVAGLIHEDPFTRHSFQKPRGYSGDASLLDLIYRHAGQQHMMRRASDRGRAIYAYTSASPSAEAVREQRELLAREVDRCVERSQGAGEILAVAAGHLREAELSRTLAADGVRRWVALDQDPESVAAVGRSYLDPCIQPVEGSVRGLLNGRYELGRFGLVYAAGLYDYLSEPVAIRLTQCCTSMLRPGGTFLFANFADDIVDSGYMETFMDWTLLLRREAEVERIARAGAAVGGEFSVRVARGANRAIIYAWIRRLA